MLLNIVTNLWPTPSKSTQLYEHNNTYFSNTNFFGSDAIKCFSKKKRAMDKRLCYNRARRRIRFEEEEEDDDYNEEIGILEMYSQSVRGEALLVTAMVDDQQVQVLIFKGFSSSLSYKTSSDPSRSVLPQRAKIESIDRIKSPFNPANIDYIEKGLTWETFKTRFCSS